MATMHCRMGRTGLVCVWLAALGLAGCESPGWTKSANESFGIRDDSSGARTAEDHRRDYVNTHSSKSIRWLLNHRVKQGMSYDQVCHILGEDGERETND